MKYILLILCITLVGCEKSDVDKDLIAQNYLQAGLINEAEKYYQDLIVSEKNEQYKSKWKNKLFQLYIKSNQLHKADAYLSFVSFSSIASINSRDMLTSSSQLSDAFFRNADYGRAFTYAMRTSEILEDKCEFDNTNKTDETDTGKQVMPLFGNKYEDLINNDGSIKIRTCNERLLISYAHLIRKAKKAKINESEINETVIKYNKLIGSERFKNTVFSLDLEKIINE